MRINEFYFRLWAHLTRQTVYIGYPRVQPFYTPAQAGNVWEQAIEQPSDAEIEIAEQVGHAVAEMSNDYPDLVTVLKEFYGAYADPPSKNERLKKLKMNRRNAYTLEAEARRWVEGFLRGNGVAE